MACSGDKLFSSGRSNCLVHMTRTVSMSWVLLKGLQLICLACTALPTAFVHSQEDCQLRRSFDSRFLQASFREEAVLDAGCQMNNPGHRQQIHVLNYKSTHAGSSPANVLVNIDSGSVTIRTSTLVLVLNSNISVEWEVELQPSAKLDVFLLKFEISRTSSLEFASQSKSCEVNNNITSSPVDDQELLSWVRRQYGEEIVSYSAFHDVDEVTMVINPDSSAPSDCDPTSRTSLSKGFIYEDQTIWGCGPGRYDMINRRQIHVIELFSPTKNLEDNSEEVDVHIQKGEDLEEGPRDTLLILVGLSSTLWKVESSRINGKLTIISNSRVSSLHHHFTEVEMKIYNNIMATKKGLLQWVEEEYGPVSSFSNVRVANLFQMYLAGPTPVILTSPSTLVESATHRTFASRLGNTELANSIQHNCQNTSIEVVVPIEMMLKYDLQPEAVTWHNKSCSASLTEEGLVLSLVLRLESQSCGSTYSYLEDAVEVSNQVTFYSSPVSEGSGMAPSDDEDEDSVQILAQKPVTCTFDIINVPAQTPEPIPRPLPTDISLYLDPYTDIKFAVRRTVQPYRLEIGDPVYFEMGVTREPRLNIVMGECWIGIPQAKLFEERLTSITEDGCPVEPSFQYLPVEFQPYQTKMPPGTVKRFTFNLPDLDRYVMTFYVFCNLSLCTNARLHEYPQIVKCSSVPKENAPCSEWKQLKLWPMKNVQIGPFRVNSRELEHDNLTGAASTNCQNAAGGALQVTSPIFAVVIFISFFIGVLLVSSIWLITKYTRVPSSSSPANSPVGNGHIPNGHVPNGEARYEMQPFMQDGVNPNNIPHEGLYDGFGDPQV